MQTFAEVGEPVEVPPALENYLRSLDAPATDELSQVAEDLWISDSYIGLHTDSTEEGKEAFGVVLLNDSGLLLYADGRLFPLPVGTLYHIDGREPHAALPRPQCPPGRFAVLVWDMPAGTTLDAFRAEVTERLQTFEPPPGWMNVCPACSHSAAPGGFIACPACGYTRSVG